MVEIGRKEGIWGLVKILILHGLRMGRERWYWRGIEMWNYSGKG